MPEDKQAICDALCTTLRLTRNLCNLYYLRYDGEREMVEACFNNGFTIMVNVALDSGTAMIKDIMKRLS